MRPPESFIGQPIRSLQTMLQTISLEDPRQPSVIPDGIYGPETMMAVTAFQRKSGIPVTGIVDRNTWEKVVEAAEPAKIRNDKVEPIEILLEPGEIFRKGDANPYLYLVQTLLLQLSGDSPSIPAPSHTGILDTETAAAIAAFQVLAGLRETGELDRITWFNLSKQYTLSLHKARRKKC